MAGSAPIRDGWQALKRMPALILCEIAWRWTFGVALWAVLIYIFARSLGQVRISGEEIKLIRAFDPYSTAYVMLRVINAILPTVLRVCLYCLPGLVILWIAAASVGRAATLSVLLRESRKQIRWGALVGINVLRVVVLFAAALALVGCSILVGRMFRGDPQFLGAAILLGVGLDTLVLCAWSALNWFLSLAPIFVVRDGAGTLGAFGSSIGLLQQRTGCYVGAALGLGLARVAIMTGATVASMVPLALVGASRVAVVLGMSLVIALGYWALTDVVQIWRIAAYVSLVEYEGEAEVAFTALEPLPAPEIPPPTLADTAGEISPE